MLLLESSRTFLRPSIIIIGRIHSAAARSCQILRKSLYEVYSRPNFIRDSRKEGCESQSSFHRLSPARYIGNCFLPSGLTDWVSSLEKTHSVFLWIFTTRLQLDTAEGWLTDRLSGQMNTIDHIRLSRSLRPSLICFSKLDISFCPAGNTSTLTLLTLLVFPDRQL